MWMCSSWVNPAYTCKYISQWYTIYSWSLALFQHSCMVWHPCICHITTLHVASRCILSLIYCSYKLFISYQHIQFYDTHASVLIIIDHHISFIFTISELLQMHALCKSLENSYQGVLSCLVILHHWHIYIFYIFFLKILLSLIKFQLNCCSNSVLA